ncbi:Aste57867_22747 [Aphanomyces stellatus]|uniref:Aste57867_22747 protein n=1 Tax=Aphanomyces stellatus TaxID=120398 RepID=A0A485LML1_9STRA|nr:hypothetical protein As57867_022677 [Aphanomyces stellatus]VFT99400.1 Aste57867_22747 [Aphanomyces stellatus]
MRSTSESKTTVRSNQTKPPASAPREGSRARQSISRSDKEVTPEQGGAADGKKAAKKPGLGKDANAIKKAGTPPPTTTRASSANNNQVEKALEKLSTKDPGTKKLQPLPSQSLHKHKQADPWSNKKKHKTNFGAAYAAGNIPCRINHGGIKNQLQWNEPPEELEYNPLLVTCCEGFQETDHPYVFLARQGFHDLMHANGADDKVRPLLGMLIPPIRGALMSSDDDVITVALQAVQLVSQAVGSDMNVHLAKLIQQMHRKCNNKALKGTVDATLAALEQHGGTEALRIIRTKIPTYVSLA